MHTLFGSDSFKPPQCIINYMLHFMYTIRYICYSTILIQVWKFQTPFCIESYMNCHLPYMLYNLQCHSYAGSKDSNPHYVLYMIRTFIYTICFLCYHAILIRVWKFQTTLMYYIYIYIIWSFIPTIWYWRYNTIVIRVWKFQTLIKHYRLYETSCNLYDIYGSMRFLIGSEGFKPHCVLSIIWTWIDTICYIGHTAILIWVRKFQTPLCNTYYMNLHILYKLFTLHCK